MVQMLFPLSLHVRNKLFPTEKQNVSKVETNCFKYLCDRETAL